jgi:glycosyltransferase involved in cell wall biosynthesis
MPIDPAASGDAEKPAVADRGGDRLSVVIPTYNRRELVLRAVQSVLAQDADADTQILVVDDASSDGTVESLHERYAGDPRVQVLACAERRHASAARNFGFAHARGDLVCFLDSDDYWLPGTLAAIRRVFRQIPQLAFVSVDGTTLPTTTQAAVPRVVAGHAPGWSHAAFARAGLSTQSIELEHDVHTSLLLGDFLPAITHGDLFYLSGLVMRREYAARAGPFNERLRYFNDWEFFSRLCLQGPGAYLAYDGFRRDTGRADQISRQRPPTATARRHLFIVRSLLRRDDTQRYTAALHSAFSDACYMMARALQASSRRNWARRYLYRCLRRRYKVWRSLALLLLR